MTHFAAVGAFSSQGADNAAMCSGPVRSILTFNDPRAPPTTHECASHLEARNPEFVVAEPDANINCVFEARQLAVCLKATQPPPLLT